MLEHSGTLLILLAILTFGLAIPELFKRFRLPFVTLLILSGAILGPGGLGYVQSNDIIEFFGFLGMTFLMLMTGFESDISNISNRKKKIFTMAFLNGVIPFIVGFLIVYSFGYSIVTSLLVGTIFVSSSVAIIIPSLKSSNLLNSRLGKYILPSIIITDVASLVLLGMILQSVSPITQVPYFVFLILMAVSVFLFLFLGPVISKFLFRKYFSGGDDYEEQFRFVIVLAFASLLFFSVIDIHPIIAGFLVGLMLSHALPKRRSKIIDIKLHTISYGLFIPVFFFIVGMQMDLSLFREFSFSNVIMISVILGLIISKLISGYVAGRLVKISHKQSLIYGSISITQLTTTLAATYAAASLGILDSLLTTSIILLSIITTFLGPMLVSLISRKH